MSRRVAELFSSLCWLCWLCRLSVPAALLSVGCVGGLCWLSVPCAAGGPVVHTEHGALRGVLRTLPGRLRPVRQFLGVPYAAPPLGSARFGPPRTAPPWSGQRGAERPASVCPQQLPPGDPASCRQLLPARVCDRLQTMRPKLANQSEDCLYLNVYAPAKVGKKLYPVMVYIHGDSYLWSSGNVYDGAVLASYGDVIVVTISYRLGLFGFLSTAEDGDRPAQVTNNGLLDQIAALHWLQQHVAAFGGDPSRVTLFGHGTGAVCISLLMNSPAVVTDLFQRAALLAGSSLSPAALVQEPQRYAAELGLRLNCSTAAPLRACLRRHGTAALLAASPAALQFLPTFGPSVDGVTVRARAAPESRATGRAAGRAPRYDLLLGVSGQDAFALLPEADVRSGFEGERRDRLLRTFVRNVFCHSHVEIFYSIINAYTNWSNPRRHPITLRDETLSALSDALFVAPVLTEGDVRAPLQAAAADRRRTFVYVFSYSSETDDAAKRLGSVHGAELPFVFGDPLLPATAAGAGYTASQAALSQIVMTYWTNFAKTGDPNKPRQQPPAGLRDRERSGRYRAGRWPPYDITYKKYLDIGRKLRVRSHYRSREVAFWRELVPRLEAAGRRAGRPPLQFESATGLNTPALFSGRVRPSCAPKAAVQETGGEPAVSASPSPAAPPAAVTTQSLHTISRSHGPPRLAAAGQRDAYSLLLGVTVTIGGSLLVLNLLIFAGIYRQRQKWEAARKRLQGGAAASASTVSLDVSQGASLDRRGRRHSCQSSCSVLRASGGCLRTVEVPQTMLHGVGSETELEVPQPPPPPRSAVPPPLPEAQPLLLRDCAVVPAHSGQARRRYSADRDAIRDIRV